ncbi:MAG: PH domain-containing protein [Acidimicrobiia bacterium]
MPWPEDALTADETLITTFRPHWKLLALPFVWFVLLSIALGLVFGFTGLGTWALIPYLGLAIWLVVSPLLTWWTSLYVLTSERLMTRRGLISKSGIEIPLENITNVNFAQTVFERVIGAGDLLVESAGTSGQSKFKDIPRPDKFQTELYRVREERTLFLGGHHDVAPQRGGAANAEAIQKLAELREQGHITDEEFETKRRQLLEDM